MAGLVPIVGDRECTASGPARTPKRAAIDEALPIEGEATLWGDELYFRTGIDVPVEEAKTEVPVGAIAYWAPGQRSLPVLGTDAGKRGRGAACGLASERRRTGHGNRDGNGDSVRDENRAGAGVAIFKAVANGISVRSERT